MSAQGPNEAPAAPVLPAGGPRRAASVTLSQQRESVDTGVLMDPANQSLADALRITFRLVQLAMIVLGVLYLLSGFQSVRENEQGIRLLFGKRDSAQIDPGFRFSYPAPVGELIKVDTGQVDLELDSDFWVYVDPKAKDTPLDSLGKLPALNPEREGSVLTADGNIAHTKWRVTYSRDPVRVAAYAENMVPGEDERGIVRAAVRRGVVQAVARVTIDDLLKQAAGEAGSVASRAKEIAQGGLDRLGSGVRIDKLLLTEKMPPLFVRDKFNAVQTSESEASKARDQARSERDRKLNETAGAAAGPLTTLIARYEVAVEKADPKGKDAYLSAINAVLDGDGASVDDLEYPAGRVSGEVTAILGQARQYRADNVNGARAELSRFQAKLNQFKTSPLVTIHREWADSLRVFMNRDFVQVMWAPKATRTMVLHINADPSIIKDLEQKAKERQGDAARAERERIQQLEKFKLETGLKATPH